jgi:CubicO group peptidase (beta-lactamase class C family)
MRLRKAATRLASLAFATLFAVAMAASTHVARAQVKAQEAAEASARRLGAPGIGVVIGVVHSGREPSFFAWGEGDAAPSPVTPSSVFRIGSITKVVTGLALLSLRDAGALSLDDAIDRFLPEGRGLFRTPLTIRHLVTHTSGLPRAVPSGRSDEGSLLAKLKWVQLGFAPGTKSSYSNLAMALAGPIIARASHSPFRAYVGDHVLAPLGMTSTKWEASDYDVRQIAHGHAVVHRPDGSTSTHPVGLESEWQMGAAEAMGGLYSTAEDMAKLVRFELAAWDETTRAEAGPVSRGTARESQTLPSPAVGPYAVAWKTAHDDALGAIVKCTGATDEYAAAVAMAPERGRGVVVLVGAGIPSAVEQAAMAVLSASN